MTANPSHDTGPAGAQGLPLEVWRGYVNAWECDEMGHMNMRFYLGRASEGLVSLAAAMGHPRAFTPNASATVLVREHHVRFLREARTANTLYMTAGLLDLGETEARVVQLLHHADGAPCAGVLTRLVHATPDGRAFPWPERTRAAAEALQTQAPTVALPRGIPDDLRPPLAAESAEAAGLTRVGLGAVQPRECDVFGYLSAEAVLGRLSDGVAQLSAPIRRALETHFPDTRLGGAALEYRLDYVQRLRAGTLVEVRSRICKLEERVLHVEHWLCEPVSGVVWAHAFGVSAVFDLDARKILPLPAELRAQFGTDGGV